MCNDSKPIPGFIRPYEEVPEVVRDYADFICNVADLGEGMGSLYALENKRIEMHMAMVKEFGLRYEYTREAVFTLHDDAISMRPERIAQRIDANLRYIQVHIPEAREDFIKEDIETPAEGEAK